MVNAFLTKLGLPSIKTGDPSLSIMEAAAQADFRSSMEMLKVLATRDLAGCVGTQLDAVGRDEKVRRIAASAATGDVEIGDSAFEAINTRIYQGGLGIPAGSLVLTVEDASEFPASGSLYIGRGTTSVEGPFVYSVAPVLVGNYWTITITTPVLNYHQLGETVTLAQGGDRLIPAGTILSTRTNSAGGQVQFRTLFDATIPDGEVLVQSVPVEATSPGITGRVSANTIVSFSSPPFSTVTVTNPLPFTNGTAVEEDDDYRNRIRLARKSRAKAISSAIVYNLLGTKAVDEAGRITSVSTSFRTGEPRTIYIDDGTGYEDKDAGVVQEILEGAAVGGEQYFSLANRPVAKAYVKSLTGPFVAVPGSTLTITVGGVSSSYTFAAEDFRNPDNATAYEVVAAINAQPSLLFAARTSNGAAAFFAKSESQEDLLVTQSGANDWLGLTDRHTYTLYLYKNSELLSEDGLEAVISTKTQDQWSAISTGATLTIEVDGIPQSVTISDADFIAFNTGYLTVSQTNSLDSWATVLEGKIAGISVVPELGKLTVRSNLGRNSRASLDVTSGTLSAAMFDSTASTSLGLDSDYIFDRNSAQIKLRSPLEVGDVLEAGSASTRATLLANSGALTIAAENTSVTAESGAEIWFVIDGQPEFPTTNIGVGTSLTWAIDSSPTWGDRIAISHASIPVWANAQEGDWVIVTDSAVTQGARGAFRIAEVESTSRIHVERTTGSPTGTFSLAQGSVILVRTTSVPQRLYLPTATYTSNTLANAINAALLGATANGLTLTTNTEAGDLVIVATNGAGSALFNVRDLQTSGTSHLATIQSGNTDIGIPSIGIATTTAVSNATQFSTSLSASAFVLAKFLRPFSDGPAEDRQSNKDVERSIENEAALTLTVRPGAVKEWHVGDRMFYSRGFDLTARDNLQLLVDSDNLSGRYLIDTYRKTKIVALSGTLELSEVSGASLAAAFGTSFDWRDYVVAFKARTKTHSSPDTNKSILWRWWRHGPDGDDAQIQYQYPTAASTAISVENANVNDVIVRLQSGGARSVPTFRTTAKLGMAITALSSSLYTYQFVSNLDVSGATRTIRIGYTNRSAAFTVAETVTTSTGSATVVSDTHLGGGVGYLTVSGVVPTISSNQTITGGTSGSTATTTSGPYGYTVLTVTLPGAVTNHGLAVGTTVFFTPGNVDFLAGARQIDAVTSNTISYIDTVATIATGGAIGTVSNDLSGEVTLSGTSVVTGDIFSGVGTTFPSVYQKALKITVGGGSRDWTGQHFQGQAVNTTLAWYSVVGSSFYPLVANTAAQIATAVNALANLPVSAVAVGTAGVGTATGVVSDATYESAELGGASPWWQFTDGYNWVRSHNTPATTSDNYVYTLRNSIAASLASNADLANEDVRLVPVTGPSVAKWFSSTATSGLGARGAARVGEDRTIQLDSSALGSDSSIQVLGGSANATSTAVRGSTTVIGTTQSVVVDSNDGFGGLQFVWAQNTLPNYKTVFDALTVVDEIETNGEVTLLNTGTRAWTRIGSLTDNTAVLVEHQGDLVAITGLSPTIGSNALTTTSVNEGDWIRIQSATTPPSGSVAVHLLNKGIYRVVRVNSTTVWIENASAVEEIAAIKYDFITYNSILPGDKVSFGSTIWGDNIGEREVTALGATEWEFVLDTSEVALNAYTSNTALGADSPLFKVEAAVPSRMLKGISTIAPNGASEMTVLLRSNAGNTLINEAYGTVLTVTNKLGFSGTKAVGLDAYRRNTGLIAAASQVIFGDESNVVDFEGVASAGASYTYSGPIVKRVKVAISVRAIETEDLVNQIQSSVAAAINKTPIGKSVALSSVVTAAQVSGVSAVTIVSPIYGVGDDLIVIQPYEKAKVVDIENDISVVVIGE